MLATSSRECYEDATRKRLAWNLKRTVWTVMPLGSTVSWCSAVCRRMRCQRRPSFSVSPAHLRFSLRESLFYCIRKCGRSCNRNSGHQTVQTRLIYNKRPLYTGSRYSVHVVYMRYDTMLYFSCVQKLTSIKKLKRVTTDREVYSRVLISLS